MIWLVIAAMIGLIVFAQSIGDREPVRVSSSFLMAVLAVLVVGGLILLPRLAVDLAPFNLWLVGR